MRILSTASFEQIQPLTSDNYGYINSSLNVKLPEDVAECFAKFTMLPGQNSAQWSIDCDSEEEFKPLSEASTPQRKAVDKYLEYIGQQVQKSGVVSDPNILLCVPNEDRIFFRQTPEGYIKVAITQWGMKNIGTASSLYHVSVNTIGPGGDERGDVNLRLLWSDDTPLSDTPVKVGIYGAVYDNRSNDVGLVSLGSVAVNERFTVDVEGLPTQTLRTDANTHEYTVRFPYNVDASLTCVDENKNPLPEIVINVNGKPTKTDKEGRIEFKGLLLEKDSALTVDYQGADRQRFPLRREGNDFTYVIISYKKPEPPAPPVKPTDDDDPLPPAPDNVDNTLKVHLRLVNKKNQPFSYARAEVRMQTGSKIFVTDKEGYIHIDQKLFTQGEKVKVRILPGAADKIPVNNNNPEKPATAEKSEKPATPSVPNKEVATSSVTASVSDKKPATPPATPSN